MKSTDYFERGYAIPQYDINSLTLLFRFREEQFVTDMSVRLIEVDGMKVARIEEVRQKAH